MMAPLLTSDEQEMINIAQILQTAAYVHAAPKIMPLRSATWTHKMSLAVALPAFGKVAPHLRVIQAMTLRLFSVEVANALRVQFGSPLIRLAFSSPLVRSISTGKKRDVEALWRDLFANTAQWWDHRPEKINPKFPDFKHKQTGEALWLADVQKPPWVQVNLAAIPPGTLQSDAFAWAQRLKRYVRAGQYKKTVEVFHQMQQERICPDVWTFLPVLQACAGLRIYEEGKRVHRQTIQVGCESDIHVATCLVHMYAKCGSIEDAWSVFYKMRKPTVASWNAMIGGYVKIGQALKAMELFQKMQLEGIEPSSVTFVGVLNACAASAALEEGRRLHQQIIQRGCESNDYVATSLVHMYAKCGSIEDAWSVFNKMQEHDVVSWSAVIGGYVKYGQALKAMELFRRMQQEGVEPNAVTFVGVLKACASVSALEEGKRVHEQTIKIGCESSDYVATSLVDMYAKCGSIESAWSVFNKMRKHNVGSWSAIIGCYVKSGQALKAMELCRKMQQEGVEPDAVTFVAVLNACAGVALLDEGRRVHDQIIQSGHESDIYVATSLVDMYAKCGSIEDAWRVFKKMQEHNVVSWNVMIGGYVESGKELKAIELFWEMQQEGVSPDVVTFIRVLSACARIGALEDGRRVHEQIIQSGCKSDVCVATCLVDMYAKCGSIESAWGVFNKMEEHDVISWNAMIEGYAMHGHAKRAIRLFRRMLEVGIEVNEVTFTCLLSACRHGGLVKEGLRYFKFMASCLNMFPTAEHYARVIDLLGHTGHLEEAEKMAKRMPMHGDATVWMSLLDACRVQGNIEMAERAAKQCWELDPGNSSGHVLLSNLYAAGKWDKVQP